MTELSNANQLQTEARMQVRRAVLALWVLLPFLLGYLVGVSVYACRSAWAAVTVGYERGATRGVKRG